MVKISSLLELRLVTSLSLNFLKMMVMLLARAVLQNRRIEANTKSFLEKRLIILMILPFLWTKNITCIHLENDLHAKVQLRQGLQQA